MAQMIGGGAEASAWSFAFKIPNLCRRVFGEGLLAPILVPLISQSLEKNGRESTVKQFSVIFMWMALILCAVSVIVSCGALVAMRFVHQEHFVLACQLIPLLMPYGIFICLVGIATSALNSFRIFFLPAVLNLLLNICMIVTLLWICPHFRDDSFWKLSSLAYAVLVSGILELILIFILMSAHHLRLILSWKNFIRIHIMKELGGLMFPGLLGAMTYQLSVFIDDVIAMWISSYAVSALAYSNRLINLPIGVFAMAFGTVSLPEMSGMAQRKEFSSLIETQFFMLRSLLFLTVPLMSFMFLFHEELVRLFFYRGKFDLRALYETSYALMFYTCGIPAFAALKITLAGFYSRKEMKTPMLVGVACTILNLILNLSLMIPLKQGGLALSTAICSYLNNLILLLILQKQLGTRLPLKETACYFFILLLISIPGLFPALECYRLLKGLSGVSRGFSLIPAMTGAATVYSAIYLLIAVILNMGEISILRSAFTRVKKVRFPEKR